MSLPGAADGITICPCVMSVIQKEAYADMRPRLVSGAAPAAFLYCQHTGSLLRKAAKLNYDKDSSDVSSHKITTLAEPCLTKETNSTMVKDELPRQSQS